MNQALKSVAAAAASVFAGMCFAAPNLVVNGNFEGGNNGFSSTYTYSPANNFAEDQYTVRSDPFPWNPFFVTASDHTSDSGMMYVGNGSPTSGDLVWGSTTAIAVTAGTTYFFESFVMNVCCNANYTGPNSAAELEFIVAGNITGTQSLGIIATQATAGTWEGLSKIWLSGTNTSAILTLINRNTQAGGNDFALDDVYLGTESTVVSSPVPEPESYALMLAGLGVIGWTTRRKSSVSRRRPSTPGGTPVPALR